MSSEIQVVKNQIEQFDNMLPSPDTLKTLLSLADHYQKAGMLPPGYKTPQDLLVVTLRGRELGVSMGEAIQGMFPMKGRIGYMGSFMMARVQNRYPEAVIKIKTSDKEKCVLEWKKRKEDEFLTEEFTMEEVRACNYNQNWDKEKNQWNPKPTWKDQKNMLYWRCLGRLINRWFPEVFGTPVYTADELQDAAADEVQSQQVQMAAAMAGAPYTNKANTAPVPPAVSEIEEVAPTTVDAQFEEVKNDTKPPVEPEPPAPTVPPAGTPPKMNVAMIDALSVQFTKDLEACENKRQVDELFENFKKSGVPGTTLTWAFQEKKARIVKFPKEKR